MQPQSRATVQSAERLEEMIAPDTFLNPVKKPRLYGREILQMSPPRALFRRTGLL